MCNFRQISNHTKVIWLNVRFQSNGNNRAVVERRGYEWPPQAQNASASCDTRGLNEVCYRTGDVRTNQNPGLAILQIILMREHNRIADVLQQINPHWDDELTYQEARRINIAQYQHISYYEWLPIFLGVSNMVKNRLIYQIEPGSYVNDYDQTIDPSILNSHATAAFRYFHSQIEGRLEWVRHWKLFSSTWKHIRIFSLACYVFKCDFFFFLSLFLSVCFIIHLFAVWYRRFDQAPDHYAWAIGLIGQQLSKRETITITWFVAWALNQSN